VVSGRQIHNSGLCTSKEHDNHLMEDESMTLFGKKRPAVEPRPATGLGAPVLVKGGDIAAVAELMQQFNRSVGDGAAERRFGIAFNRAGGYVSSIDAVNASGIKDALTRPWLWLAAVSRAALAQDNSLLVAQIAVMTAIWTDQIAPNLGGVDMFDGVLMKPSPSARAQIHSLTLEAIPAMPADSVIFENPTGVISADIVMKMSASEILKLQDIAEPVTVAKARQLLAQ
jgi:hypothetical protein